LALELAGDRKEATVGALEALAVLADAGLRRNRPGNGEACGRGDMGSGPHAAIVVAADRNAAIRLA
jgi:hypothetical protein